MGASGCSRSCSVPARFGAHSAPRKCPAAALIWGASGALGCSWVLSVLLRGGCAPFWGAALLCSGASGGSAPAHPWPSLSNHGRHPVLRALLGGASGASGAAWGPAALFGGVTSLLGVRSCAPVLLGGPLRHIPGLLCPITAAIRCIRVYPGPSGGCIRGIRCFWGPAALFGAPSASLGGASARRRPPHTGAPELKEYSRTIDLILLPYKTGLPATPAAFAGRTPGSTSCTPWEQYPLPRPAEQYLPGAGEVAAEQPMGAPGTFCDSSTFCAAAVPSRGGRGCGRATDGSPGYLLRQQYLLRGPEQYLTFCAAVPDPVRSDRSLSALGTFCPAEQYLPTGHHRSEVACWCLTRPSAQQYPVQPCLTPRSGAAARGPPRRSTRLHPPRRRPRLHPLPSRDAPSGASAAGQQRTPAAQQQAAATQSTAPHLTSAAQQQAAATQSTAPPYKWAGM